MSLFHHSKIKYVFSLPYNFIINNVRNFKVVFSPSVEELYYQKSTDTTKVVKLSSALVFPSDCYRRIS